MDCQDQQALGRDAELNAADYAILAPTDQEFALWLGKRRAASVPDETENSANFFEDKGMPPWWRHYLGVLGERAYSILTGEPVNTWTIGRGDDGSDFAGRGGPWPFEKAPSRLKKTG